MMVPLLFHPVYKDYLWGGRRFQSAFSRELPAGVVAESWEISDRADGMSVVCNGPMSGKPFSEVVAAWGEGLLGARVRGRRFPLLIKLIDARERLSVQVHPNDATAARFGGEAKTECWYLLDTDPGAGVYAGFLPGVERTAYEDAVAAGSTGSLLRRLAVRRGDAVFIPGGLVHAIDAGCLILEVQQNSNTTYRIDDWGRVGADGKPRELHVKKAAEVIRWDVAGEVCSPTPLTTSVPGVTRERLVCSDYFVLDRMHLGHAFGIDGEGQTFTALFVASGSARITWPGGESLLPAGTSCLVPAALSGVNLVPSPSADVLLVTVPS